MLTSRDLFMGFNTDDKNRHFLCCRKMKLKNRYSEKCICLITDGNDHIEKMKCSVLYVCLYCKT